MAEKVGRHHATKGPMLSPENARCEAVGLFAWVQKSPHLKENRALVVGFADAVNGQARLGASRCNYSLVNMVSVHSMTAKIGEQRGVYVVASPAKSLNPKGGNRLQIARKHQGSRVHALPKLEQALAVFVRIKVENGHFEVPIPHSSVFSVGPNADCFNGPIGPQIQQGTGIAAAAGCENYNVLGYHGLKVGGEMHHNSKDWLFFAPTNDSKKLVMSDIASRVHSIIIDKLGVPASEVTSEASFTGDLGADSLDTVELIMEFEKEFDISIPDDQAESIGTVGQAITYIEAAKA